jgi:hypothetical protein
VRGGPQPQLDATDVGALPGDVGDVIGDGSATSISGRDTL